MPEWAKQSFRFPASLKGMPETLGLLAEDGCPNVAEELWVTVQGDRYHL